MTRTPVTTALTMSRLTRKLTRGKTLPRIPRPRSAPTTPSAIPDSSGVFPSVFRALAQLRNARVFHPHGLVLDGELTVLARGPLPWEAGTRNPVLARMSRGIGLPGDVPDVLGLSIRLLDAGGPSRHWDFALASCGWGPAQVIPFPARSWDRARYSTLAPYRLHKKLVWLSATIDELPGASLEAVERGLRTGPLRATLHWRGGVRGKWQPFAQLELHTQRQDEERLGYDPMLHRPQELQLYPQWLAKVRELAYVGSRVGRPHRQAEPL
ncbi:hypothetical protein [Saccharopolyspora rectivirgula]|uniref:hypothetical protein n=1 Tax=Saccharopolyspora rectivirgula TaxID=28042 RepID=UPI000411057F|nr:hypothetical protein [Saccharopolyspora rectivirgula]